MTPAMKRVQDKITKYWADHNGENPPDGILRVDAKTFAQLSDEVYRETKKSHKLSYSWERLVPSLLFMGLWVTTETAVLCPPEPLNTSEGDFAW